MKKAIENNDFYRNKFHENQMYKKLIGKDVERYIKGIKDPMKGKIFSLDFNTGNCIILYNNFSSETLHINKVLSLLMNNSTNSNEIDKKREIEARNNQLLKSNNDLNQTKKYPFNLMHSVSNDNENDIKKEFSIQEINKITKSKQNEKNISYNIKKRMIEQYVDAPLYCPSNYNCIGKIMDYDVVSNLFLIQNTGNNGETFTELLSNQEVLNRVVKMAKNTFYLNEKNEKSRQKSIYDNDTINREYNKNNYKDNSIIKQEKIILDNKTNDSAQLNGINDKNNETNIKPSDKEVMNKVKDEYKIKNKNKVKNNGSITDVDKDKDKDVNINEDENRNKNRNLNNDHDIDNVNNVNEHDDLDKDTKVNKVYDIDNMKNISKDNNVNKDKDVHKDKDINKNNKRKAYEYLQECLQCIFVSKKKKKQLNKAESNIKEFLLKGGYEELEKQLICHFQNINIGNSISIRMEAISWCLLILKVMIGLSDLQYTLVKNTKISFIIKNISNGSATNVCKKLLHFDSISKIQRKSIKIAITLFNGFGKILNKKFTN